MNLPITNIDVRLVPPDVVGRVLAFVTIEVAGCLAIHDVRIIRGGDRLFVAMPSRKLTDRCPGCGARTPCLAAWCSDCGLRLDPDRPVPRVRDGKPTYYLDIVHPTDAGTRMDLERTVLRAYCDALESARVGNNGMAVRRREVPR